MARLQWRRVGDRTYEHGVDLVVVYPESREASAWNGVASITENNSTEVAPYYLDGIKYVQVPSFGEYGASIESYTTPEALLECIGIASLSPGLFATNQRRKSFGLCYRTFVGNDVDGPTAHYKLHLVYGAVADMNAGAANTDSDNMEAARNTWDITTVPPEANIALGRPTAHLIVDSRTTPPEVLDELETLLYGGPYTEPRLPSPSEVQAIFNPPTTS